MFSFLSLSINILTEGEKVSSNWPSWVAQRKAAKKPIAIKSAKITNKISMLIFYTSFLCLAIIHVEPTANRTTEMVLNGINIAANTGESIPVEAQPILKTL